MSSNLRYALQNAGFLARSSVLRELGHSRTQVFAAVADGWLTRPVRPWLATRSAPRDAIIAVLHRGVLTDASALGAVGVWRGLDRAIHVSVSPHSSGTVGATRVPLADFVPPKHPTVGIVRHWDGVPTSDWKVTTLVALASFARSQSPEHFIAAVESALHTKSLRPSEVTALRALLPARLRSTLDQVDARAEAGTETLARLRLRPMSRSLDIQVHIGPHRVDILIDGWLVIELDSEEWHASTRLENLQRDAWLTARGYRVLRLDYAQVMYDWDGCEAAVRAMLQFPPARRPVASPR